MTYNVQTAMLGLETPKNNLLEAQKAEVGHQQDLGKPNV